MTMLPYEEMQWPRGSVQKRINQLPHETEKGFRKRMDRMEDRLSELNSCHVLLTINRDAATQRLFCDCFVS
jgi:hypothetical protein